MWENTLNLNLLAATNLTKFGTGAIKDWKNKKTARITFYHSLYKFPTDLSWINFCPQKRQKINTEYSWFPVEPTWFCHGNHWMGWGTSNIQKSLSVKTVHNAICELEAEVQWSSTG